jgi:hypothetical protein
VLVHLQAFFSYLEQLNGEKGEKIDLRKRLADQLGIPIKTLRMRALRKRTTSRCGRELRAVQIDQWKQVNREGSVGNIPMGARPAKLQFSADNFFN